MPLNYLVAALLVVLGLYCVLLKRNIFKIVIGLGILADGIHLFLISLGYRAVANPTAPIVTGDIPQFLARAVDPVPQALVLTSIVINVCILALALSLGVYSYKVYGTLDPFNLRRLKG